MSKPGAWSFTGSDQLVAELRKQDWKKNLREVHSKNPDLGPLTAIYHAVSSSTYRSFRKRKDWTLSVVFRGWASTELFHGECENLAGYAPMINTMRGQSGWREVWGRSGRSGWGTNSMSRGH